MNRHIMFLPCLDRHNGSADAIRGCQVLRADVVILSVIKPGNIIVCEMIRRLFGAHFHTVISAFRHLIAKSNAVIIAPHDDLQL